MIDTFSIILIVLYFILVLYIGFSAKKGEDDEGFLLANRKLGTFALTGTMLASLFGGTAIIVTMSFVFNYGISTLWAFLSTTLGCFLLAALVPKIKKFADKHKHYTFSDYFYEKFGQKVGLLVAIIMFFIYFGYLIVQLIAGGIVLSTLTSMPYMLSVLLIGSVIIIYIFAAGFEAVVKTDVFQYIIILLLVVLSFNIFSHARTIPSSDLNLFAAGPVTIIGFLIYGFMIMTLGAEFWQRIYAAKSEKVARNSLILTGIIFLFLGILVVLIGLSVKSNFPNIVPTTALVVGFQKLLSGYLLGIGLVLLFAAVMSSADTFLFVLSTSLSKDFFGRFKKLSKSRLTANTKISTIIIGVAGILVALIFSNIINVVTSIVGVGFALFPSTLISFWIKLNPKVIITSVTLGILSSVLAFVFMGISVESALVSFPVSLIVLIIGQAIVKLKK
ncbi:hypothetical protein COV13_04220 [Candidatus Woesearchaeota archaeon CG10_big_fil_rev_8_21_14_0_10_32_9]|nr:MAG: hypothetical protein COV13_04220 [Candidatus Woesearchaeota archaeon CG10_big_fil_rev_8_21_14_0_10_32_9]